ncbi:MAG TPA: glycosyltransferase [Solirubrobacteraceae bacterium]|jgi:glycosyltransferase involved in cell wall biosynthesis|nr:glycosyltransferase [Solirubrobacteraceae bacterium]
MSNISTPTQPTEHIASPPPSSQSIGSNVEPPALFTNFSPHSWRVSIAHDYLLVMRGAERTFAAIADLYSQAPIFTLLYDEQGTNRRFAERAITTSPLQRLGVGQANFRRLLPLYPYAVERLRPPACDVVISSSSAFAHGMRVPDGAAHVCYCYTPFRYAWYEEACALGEVPPLLRPLLRRQLHRMRSWDRAASERVDAYIAISELSRERIRRYYGRNAPVIHPPVEIHRFAPGKPGDALLVVSEFVRHKRLHVALEAAHRAGVPIRVVGSGPDHAALREAYPNAEFLGRASDEELAELYASARAVVVPSVEEFGITAVEAQAAGRPVIAAAAGGALETVLDGQTGRLARLDDVDSFAQAIRELDELDFDPARAVQNAERFSVAAFQRRLAEEVARAIQRSGEARVDRDANAARAHTVHRYPVEETHLPIAACAAEQL